MGFDINGLSPNPDIKDENNEPIGTYFRNNVWWWRQMWALIGSVGEFVIRQKEGIPIDHEDDQICKKHLAMLEEWRDKYNSGTYNDGTRFEDKNLEIVTEALEFVLENKEHKQIVNFLDYISDELGDNYQFSWENVEDFQAFVVNSGGFEIW